MSFWSKNYFDYHFLGSLSKQGLIQIVNSMSRTDIIEWLTWNDPNGIYTDELSYKELGNLMSREEGMEILIRQIEENRVP